jgi:hypothetical protein
MESSYAIATGLSNHCQGVTAPWMPDTTTVTVFGPFALQVKVSDSAFRISLQFPLLAE